jgi:capsular polysaccharide biosynthesis protein
VADPNLQSTFLAFLRKYGSVYRTASKLSHHCNDSLVNFARRVFRNAKQWGPPTGTFSALELVRNGSVPGSVIIEGQELSPAAPDTMHIRQGLGQNGRQPWPVFWSLHRHAHLVGRSLALLDDQKKIMVESVYGPEFSGSDPSNRYLRLPDPVRLEGNWTSLISLWDRNYYHWHLDALPRLALIAEFPPDTRILVPPDLQPFEIESLRLLGLEGRYRRTPERHLLVENYYFSSPTAMSGCDNPRAIEWLRSRFLEKADYSAPTPKRIYVQRKNKTRGLQNEREVADFFAAQGWSILDLEGMTQARQIHLFANAEAVCAVHGAALTNLLWCRPGCKAIELFASNFLNGCYEGVAAYTGADYRYLIFEADSMHRARVDLDLLKTALST